MSNTCTVMNYMLYIDPYVHVLVMYTCMYTMYLRSKDACIASFPGWTVCSLTFAPRVRCVYTCSTCTYLSLFRCSIVAGQLVDVI